MLALAIFLLTLIFVITQPCGLGIGWSAAAGALLALLCGVIHPADIPTVWHIVWDATFTFIALIIISLLLDEAGFFEWAALHVARWGAGSGRMLFALLVILGGAVSAVFANDGAALLLTPIVIAILLRLNFSPAQTLAFVIASGFVADTTSLPLIISNLVNIVSANYFHITFNRYALVMAPIDLISLAATLAVLFLFCRQNIPARYEITNLEAPASTIRDPLIFKAAFPVLGILLLAYFILAPRGVPVSFVTCAGAAILLALAARGKVISVRQTLRGAPWNIVVFSLGMYLVVYGLRNAGLTAFLASGLEWLAPHGPLAASIATGFAAALLSSVMNNLPAILTGTLAIAQTQHLAPLTREAMIYANIIGCDLGPKFTPLGSLATLLWLEILSRKNIRISWGRYMKIGLIVTPPVLLVVLVGLAIWLPLIQPR